MCVRAHDWPNTWEKSIVCSGAKTLVWTKASNLRIQFAKEYNMHAYVFNIKFSQISHMLMEALDFVFLPPPPLVRTIRRTLM